MAIYNICKLEVFTKSMASVILNIGFFNIGNINQDVVNQHYTNLGTSYKLG